jgi:purine-binding chemotaxis protein CheW
MNEAVKKTLRKRAAALAREGQAVRAIGGRREVVEFLLASEHYAFESEYVLEVCSLKDFTPLPCVPVFVSGLINLRGQILPVLDIKVFFDLPPDTGKDSGKAIILGGEEGEFGILADAVMGCREVDLTGLQTSLPSLTGIRAEYLKGIDSDGLIVLDAAALLGDRGLVVNEEVQG